MYIGFYLDGPAGRKVGNYFLSIALKERPKVWQQNLIHHKFLFSFFYLFI